MKKFSYFFIALNESMIRRQRQNIIITQNGRPLQNPARPVLMLQAKPITKTPTRKMPIKIVIFSLNFIFNYFHLLILLVNQLAFLNNLSSSNNDETSCTPTGSSFAPRNNGRLIHGIPQ